jgi:hypothetical protein
MVPFGCKQHLFVHQHSAADHFLQVATLKACDGLNLVFDLINDKQCKAINEISICWL